MNDYIPRKALLDWVHEFYPEDKVFASAIINAPAADVAPVLHGKWVFGGDGCVICSNCNEEESNDNHRKYCPNCGAKMYGDNVR